MKYLRLKIFPKRPETCAAPPPVLSLPLTASIPSTRFTASIPSIRSIASIPSTLLAAAALTGCSLTPPRQDPAMEVPPNFKEDGTWKAAQPAAHIPRGDWSRIFQDRQLDAILREVEVSNATLANAEARARESSALLTAAKMAFLPILNLDASTTRSGTGGGSGNNNSGDSNISSGGSRITSQNNIGAVSSWEIDLWGRLRHSASAVKADAQSAAAEVEVSRLSLQSQAAQTYFSLRSVDAQRDLLDRQIKNYEKSLQITRNRYNEGIVSRGDVAQAEAQLASTKADAIETGVQRATLEHALAVLLGQAPASFTLPKGSLTNTVPRVPAAPPSSLLERRPDIASAERQVAAANERIGAAKAAFFPTISLGATGGWRGMGKLLSMPTRYWSLGPDLAQPLLDGGQRIAAKAQADATYDATVATYRQTVLDACRETEDSLATLRILTQKAEVQQQAVQAATENERIALNAYTAGTDTYLNVAVAQAASLTAQRNALDIQARRLNATVTLITALGGLW